MPTCLILQQRQPAIDSKFSPGDIARQYRHEQFSYDSQNQDTQQGADQLPLLISGTCYRLILVILCDDISRPHKVW